MGGALERRRRWFLPEIQEARRALLLGEGDGRFLSALLRRNPVVRADYVDISGSMLNLARHKGGTERVDYKQADARELGFPGNEYDLIATHFFFDCFVESELDTLIGRIAASTTLQTQWVVSEFRVSSFAARLLVSTLYLFFRITTGLKTRTLVDHRPILQSHGFRLTKLSQACGGLMVSELWERRNQQ